ncbi:MAG: PAS domain S-box protein [Gemmatimonadales bacterium]|nr:PAS domain S-box protein [Gemmatimonadales bacterium]
MTDPTQSSYPTAEQWVQVFRAAQMPLWLVDVTTVKQGIDELAAIGVTDFKVWLDSHPEFISQAIEQIRILELSEMGVKLAGARDRAEFLNSIDRLLVPESLPSFKDMIMALATGQDVRNGEAVYRTLDGKTVHTWNQVSLLKSESGRDLLLLAITDISHFKQAQERLESSEKRYRTLVETARDVILCHDLEGRLTFVNQAGLDMTGWTLEEMIGTSADDLVPPALHDEMVCRAKERTKGDSGVFLYETRFLTRTGTEIPVEVSSCLIQAPGSSGGMSEVLVMARDISTRKRAEEERRRLEARLRNAQKLESLGVLAGGVAHDFNNFLVAIMGSAELLRDQLPSGSGQEEHLDLILEASGSIADLCRQMQMYAKEENQDRGSNDISEMVRSLSRLLDVSVSGKAQLSFELEENLPFVGADQSQLGQVIINLVANSVEALNDQGGVVVIRTGCLECGEDDLGHLVGSPSVRPGKFVFCEIRDSGCGMDEEIASRLFEPFYTTKFVGRGVGLFAAQGIIQNLGGGFMVESSSGQGTKITFLLPALPKVVPVSVSRKRDPAPQAVGLAGKTVMIVDDQEGVRAVGESFLRRFGCNVLVAANGFDAVGIFGQRYQDIDIVLLDLAMEGMDGVVAGRRMRTIMPGIPIVLTSGFSEDAVRGRGASLEPFEILTKPFKKNKLREILELMLAD